MTYIISLVLTPIIVTSKHSPCYLIKFYKSQIKIDKIDITTMYCNDSVIGFLSVFVYPGLDFFMSISVGVFSIANPYPYPTGAPCLCSQFLVESKLLIYFCFLVSIILVILCSLVCVSVPLSSLYPWIALKCKYLSESGKMWKKNWNMHVKMPPIWQCNITQGFFFLFGKTIIWSLHHRLCSEIFQ